MKHAVSIIALAAALPAFAEDTRQLDAHEHGVGTLNIAMDGATVAMEFGAPGADIVGFEYEATSATDLAAIEAALVRLGQPMDLFALPEAAGCRVTDARAELEGDDGHEGHDEDDHGDHDDEHDHDKHEDDHAHEEHAEDTGHTEFHAEYMLSCDAPEALNEITFSYFEAFPNAREVEVQVISASGAQAYEVERASPVLNLSR